MVTAVGAKTVGKTVTERTVPESMLTGAETRSPSTVPPEVNALRGNSMDALSATSISARPFTVTVPELPSEPDGTVAVNPPEIFALPRSTSPDVEATVSPLVTAMVENARSSFAATFAEAEESAMG